MIAFTLPVCNFGFARITETRVSHLLTMNTVFRLVIDEND